MFHTPSDTGWQSYRLESSAVSSTVRDISVHNNGSVWVATQRGLAVLWPDADTGSVAGGGTSNVEASDRTLPQSLISITPNPLGSSGSLSLATKGGTARITLHDNLGREVVTLFDGVLEPGQRTLPIDLSTLPVGAYRLSVAIEGSSPSTRMIVVSR